MQPDQQPSTDPALTNGGEQGQELTPSSTESAPQAQGPPDTSLSYWPDSPLLADHSGKRSHRVKRKMLIAALVTLLVVASVILLPMLISEQPQLTYSGSVGQLTFSSSDQFTADNVHGPNDIVTVLLHNLSTPPGGKSDFAWLVPDESDETTPYLLLGKLTATGGNADLSYNDPNHANLLALYSEFLVTEQDSNPLPRRPAFFDPNTWRYVGRIPETPTPGDPKHFSLLDHIRHLLAKDPTLEQNGLHGGLDTWLYRNTSKILEWSRAARDSWPDSPGVVHGHMIRVLDYLDGVAYVYKSGDLSSDTPLLVDPVEGRIGLLPVSSTQELPPYLTHMDMYLHGLINAPGHTRAQVRLAIKIGTALRQTIVLMQKIHQDARTLVKMDDTQLKSTYALNLLNDMVTNATKAYAGQLDPTSDGNINGIVWIHYELQRLASIPIATSVGND